MLVFDVTSASGSAGGVCGGGFLGELGVDDVVLGVFSLEDDLGVQSGVGFVGEFVVDGEEVVVVFIGVLLGVRDGFSGGGSGCGCGGEVFDDDVDDVHGVAFLQVFGEVCLLTQSVVVSACSLDWRCGSQCSLCRLCRCRWIPGV